MTSDPWDQGDPPDWVGDVSAGVDAWARRASTPDPMVEEAVPEEVAQQPSRRVAKRPSRNHGPADPADPRNDPEADHEAVARKILLDQLTGQARSRKELADRLAKRNVPEPIAGRLLDRFEEVGLVDDGAFARSWVASRGAADGKALAKRALAQELRRKGVADEVAREVLEEVDPDHEREAARTLVRKKLRSMSRLDDQTRTRRLVGMLARKGYPPGLAFAVVREEVGGDVMPESDA